MSEEQRRELEIFEQAMGLAKEQRAEFLEDACENQAIRAEVERLLAMSEDEEDFLPTAEDVLTSVGLPGTATGERLQLRKEMVQPGSHLLDRYEVIARLGSGGTGEVYRARDARLGRDVAIKLLSGSYVSDPQMRDRFDREVRTVASLAHPNVMALYDIGEHHGIQIAVMELIEGHVLRNLMVGKMSQQRSVDIALGVAAALTAAHHRNLMHRDIKPENIMVTRDDHVKVLDFGLARPKYASGDTVLTGTAIIIGTFPYMSPEQCEGLELTMSTDVFSLGTLLFEMLVGVNPFRGDSIFETMRLLSNRAVPVATDQDASVPPPLSALLGQMHQHDPAERPTAAEVVTQLQDIRGQLPG